MAKCDRCLWADQCYTPKNECSDYTPADEYEGLEELIEEGAYEYRHIWSIYVKEHGG